MSRSVQLIAAVFALLFFVSAQAAVDLSVSECRVMADEAEDGSKKEGSETTTTEEEEPDCD